MSKIKILIFLITLTTVGLSAYQFGKQTKIITSRNLESLQQKEGIINCPYYVKGNKFTKSVITANTEAKVSGKPELIDKPRIIKTNEAFNLSEFEKKLYRYDKTDKGWDEKGFDVDGDKIKEQIITANIAMNHTPHIALIVKDGRVIFKDEGSNIWIEENNLGDGFTLHKTIDWDIKGESVVIRYLPKEGGFMAIWKQKSCWVSFM